jgi:DNA-binding NtrC family response regulator
MMNEILLADDEATFRDIFTKVLREEGMEVMPVGNGTDAIDAIMKQPYAVAILDVQMPGADGIKVLREIMRIRPQTCVIMITAHGTIEVAVEAIKLGARDYVMKPVNFDEVLTKVRQHLKFLELQEENRELKNELDGRFDISSIIGKAQPMQQVFEMIRKVARTKSNVLLTGESGTGKELVARAIHSLCENNGNRFMAINCAAIPEGLLESELFGHKKGSFTSAIEDKKGIFEMARNGTLL